MARRKIIWALGYILSQVALFLFVAVTLRLTLFPVPAPADPDWAITLAYGSLFIPALAYTAARHVHSATICLAWCLAAWAIGHFGSGTNTAAVLVYLALGFPLLALDQRWIAFFSFALGIFGVPIVLLFGNAAPSLAWKVVWNLIHSAMIMSAVIPLIGAHGGGQTQARRDRPEWPAEKAA